jgi:SP family arabinose:H+ symporter-like MFS transporter
VKGTEGTNKFGETEEGLFGELFNRRFRRPLIIAVLLMAFSQFCGINAIIYYSTKIFAAAGVGVNDAFTSSAAIGFVNLLFTFVAIALVDKARRLPLVLIGLAVLVVAAGVAACMLLAGVHGVRLLMTIVVFFAAFATVAIALADKAGRRPLLLIGLAVQVAALGAVGWMFHTGARGMGLLVAVISFTAAFAMAMGPISWILCSEIFPTKVRGRAMSVATFTIWTSCYIVAQTFPMLNDNPAIGPAKTFGVYAICSLASFIFVLAMVPETKGRSLEEIESSWHAATGKQDHARD